LKRLNVNLSLTDKEINNIVEYSIYRNTIIHYDSIITKQLIIDLKKNKINNSYKIGEHLFKVHLNKKPPSHFDKIIKDIILRISEDIVNSRELIERMYKKI
jgi:hypothetical protein